jgi:hypothetical protein
LSLQRKPLGRLLALLLPLDGEFLNRFFILLALDG